MKTIVEISDALLADAYKLTGRLRVLVRALVGRRRFRAINAQKPGGTFKLRRASFAGNGLQPGFRDGSWERIWDTVYPAGSRRTR